MEQIDERATRKGAWGSYQGYTPEQAAELFRKRYGHEPKHWAEVPNLLLLGPIESTREAQ